MPPHAAVGLPAEECDVLVVGAGMSGLVTAMRVRRARPDLRVEVIDVASYAGGKLRTAQLAGARIDVGAEAVIARRPEGIALIDELELTDRVRYPGTTDARIACGGRHIRVPQDTLMGVPTDVDAIARSGLLTAGGVQRLRERRPTALSGDPSVADAIGGQLGPEVVDRLVEPLLGGVYAGRADRLSLIATIPALRSAIAAGDDVVAAAAKVRASAPASQAPVFATLSGGIGSLPGELIAREGIAVSLRCPARSIRCVGDQFEIEAGAAAEPTVVRAKAVVVATQPQKASKLLAQVCSAASFQLADVEVASVAVVAIAYRVKDLAAPPPPISGLLVPVSEGRHVKAATFVTTKWPHVADEQVFIVRASLGRIGDDQVLQRSDADLLALARHDLAALAGISGEPLDWLVQRWAGSLPQYDVGHLARVSAIHQAVNEVPGLAVAGATYNGVGITGCINSANVAASRVLQHLEGDE